MDICGLYLELEEIVVELLGHAFGEGSDECALVALYALLYFFEKVVDLVGRRYDADKRVEQACRAYHLLYDHALALLKLIVGRGGAHIDCLACHALEFLEFEGPVVERRRETEAVLHEVFLAGAVAAIHGAHLRNCDMALVDYGEVILGEIVEEAEGAFALAPAVEIA